MIAQAWEISTYKVNLFFEMCLVIEYVQFIQ